MALSFAEWNRYLPSNPFKPPHWRWALMQTLRCHATRPVERWHDRWAEPLFEFQNAQAASKAGCAAMTPLPDAPPLAAAHRLWSAAELAWDREILHARLLTGESSAAVAQRFGLPLDLIDTYVTVFFDVCCRLVHPTYIRHRVIGPGLHRPDLASDLQIALRNLAFVGGPHVLDAFLGTMAAQIQPSELDDPALHQPPDPDLQALIRHNVAIFRHAPDAQSQQEFAWTQQLGMRTQQAVDIQMSIVSRVDPLAALLAGPAQKAHAAENAIPAVSESSIPAETECGPDRRAGEAA